MLTGLVGVWLTLRGSWWCFPFGIVNVTIYAIIFFDPAVRLYADGLLQLIYLPLQFIGWIRWRSQPQSGLQVKRTSSREWVMLLLLFLPAWLALSFLLHRFTNAYLPWLDAALTIASLIAQWQIARKQLENWLIWIAVDIVYVPLYLSRELPLTALLYLVFLLLAISGYRRWKKLTPAHG